MNFSKYSRINTILGFIVFAIALFTYTATQEASVSLWDCGEFIAASFKLEVVHPPGAPFFLMLNHFFTIFAGSPDQVPVMVNFSSALMSALTILFLFWTISAMAVKIVFKNEVGDDKKDQKIETHELIAVLGAALVGSLAYTWSDTFWFSAVEGEVYAMSSMFIALVTWLMMKWERRADDPASARWLILILFFIGLSSGVHLMSLLAIPGMALVYYFKKFEYSAKGLILTLIIGLGLLGIIQIGVIVGIPNLISKFEVLFVNSFGMPFWSGAFAFLVLLIGVVIAGIYLTSNQEKSIEKIGTALGVIVAIMAAVVTYAALGGLVIVWAAAVPGVIWLIKKYPNDTKNYLNLFFNAIAVVMIGYSSYAMVVIRSQSNPAIDMNDPQDVFKLLSYLNREQYGDRPILSGPNYTAYQKGGVDYKREGDMEYRKGKDKYEEVGPKVIEVVEPKYKTFFPRMHSRQDDHIQSYEDWTNLRKGATPTMADNFEFFFKYQANHMWLRYFGWNFIGRQNDEQGHGSFIRGNDMTGIPFIDELFFGIPASNKLPQHFKDDKSRNLLYGLPFLLGVLGLIFHYKKDKKSFIYTLVYFGLTGLALAVYLNMPPYQPRERDYVFVGSFYFFAVWIGFGVIMLYDFLRHKISPNIAAGLVTLVALIAVPLNMLAEEWDDHDRSNRKVPLAFGTNYLESCAPNAILFTNGDNDTYPLWYAQEVEGIRDDVRIINLSLLNTDWYVNQMRRPINNADSVNMSFTPKQYQQGTRDYVLFNPNHGMNIDPESFLELSNILEFIASDKSGTKAPVGNGEMIDFFPTKKFKISIDKKAVVESGTVAADRANEIVDAIQWNIRKTTLMKADLILLDIIATNAKNGWKRPIYWAITTGTDAYLNLMPYLQMEGLTYRLVPIKKDKTFDDGQTGSIETDIMYDNVMNKFQWGGLDTEEDMWVDYVMMRQCFNFRNVFVRLASKLLMEAQYEAQLASMSLNSEKPSYNNSKMEQAVNVIDRGMEALPGRNVPVGISSLGFSDLYYRIAGMYNDEGKTEESKAIAQKAFDLDQQLAKIFIEELDYFTSIPAGYRKAASDQIRTNLYGLDRITRNANQNKNVLTEEQLNEALIWKEKLNDFSTNLR